MTIFLDDVDYRKFHYILADVLDLYDVDCWDMCVMPNHYHLVLMNQQPNLPDAMRHLNGEYATWWNGRHTKVGHTFQGRYKDQIVQREGYLLNLLRYIALNPVRAGLVKAPELWPWSAYRCTAGIASNPGFICSDFVLAQFGDGDSASLRACYKRHIEAGSSDDNERYRGFRSRKRILGDRGFKLSVIRHLSTASEEQTLVAPFVSTG